MSRVIAPEQFYQVGGTLWADAPSYVERKADQELLEHAAAGDFCYVLTPRQMGKSSLMVRTATQLETQGLHTVTMDLTATIERGMAAEPFYASLLHHFIRDLDLPIDLTDWWEGHGLLSAVQRFSEFMQDELLSRLQDRVVVFIDEIDSTLSLNFSDDFFAAIRAFYNNRARNPEFNRLGFVLLGVASPSDLIKDRTRTPFNIGHRIELTDFTFDEARKLAHGLHPDAKTAQRLLNRVLYWTGGHPYLTQKVCAELAADRPSNGVEQRVDNLVHSLFFSDQQWQDSNLYTVRDCMLENKEHPEALLELYRRIRSGEPVLDDDRSPVHAALKLSGIVKVFRGGWLRPRNQIYKQVFGLDWVSTAQPSELVRQVTKTLEEFRNLPATSENLGLAQDLYQRLHRIRGYEQQADELLAAFWQRRALVYAKEAKADETLLCHLKALTIHETQRGRREVAHIIEHRTRRIQRTFRHADSANIIRFDPRGKKVLTASSSEAKLWDVESGRPVGQPMRYEHESRSPLTRRQIVTTDFSSDGREVLTGHIDGTLLCWDAETGIEIWERRWAKNRKMIAQGDKVEGVAFSPDGSKFVTKSEDGTMQLWNYKTRQPIGQPMVHRVVPWKVTFSPDNSTLVTAIDGGTVQFWDAQTGKPISKSETVHGNLIIAVAFNPDSRTLATVATDETGRILDVQSGQPIRRLVLSQRRTSVLTFNPGEHTFATGTTNGIARLWDAETGQPRIESLLHQGKVVTVAFSPDGRMLATGGKKGMARLWNAETDQLPSGILEHQSSVVAIIFGVSDRMLTTFTTNRVVQLWDTQTNHPISQPMKHRGQVLPSALIVDNRMLVTATLGGSLWFWEFPTGRLISQEKVSSSLQAVISSPDGRWLATAGDDRSVRIMEAATRVDVARLVHENLVWSMSFSPDGRWLATKSRDNVVRVWEVATEQGIIKIVHSGKVRVMRFSPDGSVLVTGTADGVAQRWHPQTGEPVGEPMGHGGELQAVSYSLDGRTLVTADDYTVRLWDAESGELLFVRFLPARFGAFRLLSDNGRVIQVALRWTENSIFLQRIRFDEPDAKPIQGEPQELLDEWSLRLGLRFDENGALVPR